MNETFAELIESRIQEHKQRHSSVCRELAISRGRTTDLGNEEARLQRQIDTLTQAYTFEKRQETP